MLGITSVENEQKERGSEPSIRTLLDGIIMLVWRDLSGYVRSLLWREPRYKEMKSLPQALLTGK